MGWNRQLVICLNLSRNMNSQTPKSAEVKIVVMNSGKETWPEAEIFKIQTKHSKSREIRLECNPCVATRMFTCSVLREIYPSCKRQNFPKFPFFEYINNICYQRACSFWGWSKYFQVVQHSWPVKARRFCWLPVTMPWSHLFRHYRNMFPLCPCHDEKHRETAAIHGHLWLSHPLT